jgi:hypothetical protein
MSEVDLGSDRCTAEVCAHRFGDCWHIASSMNLNLWREFGGREDGIKYPVKDDHPFTFGDCISRPSRRLERVRRSWHLTWLNRTAHTDFRIGRVVIRSIIDPLYWCADQHKHLSTNLVVGSGTGITIVVHQQNSILIYVTFHYFLLL